MLLQMYCGRGCILARSVPGTPPLAHAINKLDAREHLIFLTAKG